MSPVTIERPAVAAPSRLGLVSRLRNRVSAVLAMLAALVVLPAGAASATTPDSDLTGGAGDTFFTAITSYFQDNVIVAVLGLFALTVGVAVLMKWGRKAAKS